MPDHPEKILAEQEMKIRKADEDKILKIAEDQANGGPLDPKKQAKVQHWMVKRLIDHSTLLHSFIEELKHMRTKEECEIRMMNCLENKYGPSGQTPANKKKGFIKLQLGSFQIFGSSVCLTICFVLWFLLKWCGKI